MVGIFLRTYGVEKVYNSGLIDELMGNTNTAIHAYTCFVGSCRFPVNARMLIMMTGNQQAKSVKMINIILLARVESWFILVDRTCKNSDLENNRIYSD